MPSTSDARSVNSVPNRIDFVEDVTFEFEKTPSGRSPYDYLRISFCRHTVFDVTTARLHNVSRALVRIAHTSLLLFQRYKCFFISTPLLIIEHNNTRTTSLFVYRVHVQLYASAHCPTGPRAHTQRVVLSFVNRPLQHVREKHIGPRKRVGRDFRGRHFFIFMYASEVGVFIRARTQVRRRNSQNGIKYRKTT